MKPRSESDRVSRYLSSAGMSVPDKYASGGRVKPATTIQINIERDKAPAMPPMPPPPPVVNPQPAPPPMDPAAMMGGAPPGGPPMPGMKRGGRATAVPMNAGSISGDGRQNKAISQAKASGQKQPVKGTFRTAK